VSASEQALRLFVAIELPGDVLHALAGVQDRLRLSGLDGLRWVRPEGIHLTLKFLGETAATNVPEIAAAVAAATAGHAPHSLTLGKLGTFGSKANPRVLWVDVGGDVKATRGLQNSVEGALADIGFPREDRPFSPHLTLARVRPESARYAAATLAAAIGSVAAPEGTISVHEVRLMQSTLGPGGARYRSLEAFRLAGQPA
jgi:2'-5' RNA ligase